MTTKKLFLFTASLILAGALLSLVQCKQPEDDAATNAPPTITIPAIPTARWWMG